MSIRTTRQSSPIIGYAPEYDTRNAELDPGATNVGLITPYQPPPSNPPEPIIPLEDTSPFFIDGQRVTATVDGVAMSWQVVTSLKLLLKLYKIKVVLDES